MQWDDYCSLKHLNPKSDFAQLKVKLPPEIQISYDQAVKSYEIGCYDASATMSRRVIQEIARNKISVLNLAIKSDKLGDELKCLKDNQVIFPKTYKMYRSIKNIANFGAHPDIVDPTKIVTAEEAEMCLNVIVLMIKEIYENDELYERITNNSKINNP